MTDDKTVTVEIILSFSDGSTVLVERTEPHYGRWSVQSLLDHAIETLEAKLDG